MEPLDLLHLARTSKDFRSLLMSRESALLWQGARQNIEGLPDCPTFLSEPAFANLVFDTSCYVCTGAFHCEAYVLTRFVRYV